MSQMCPNCSHDNPDDANTCTNCNGSLRNLLGYKTVLSNRYEVVSILGCGAMGAVYLAEDQRLTGRRCAIKQNRPDVNATVEVRNQSREQFLAEANVLARLDHPSLPKVSDFFVENDNEFLVMDYVEGEDLDSLLQRTSQPLAENQIVAWMDQVLDGLAYLHTHGEKPIIHRDIKPANIRLNLQQNRVKLVDFGLVKLFDEENPETKLELRGIGTPAYAPLEQFATSDQHTDTRSDLYSLGATMYHLLTNLFPPDVHQRLLNSEVLVPIRQVNPDVSENLERVVLRAMEIYPDNRYQTAQQMRDALHGKRDNPTTVLPAATPQKSKAASSSPILFAAVGALAVLLILAAVAYFVFFGSGLSQPPTPEQPVVVQTTEPTEEILEATEEAPVVAGFNDAPTDTPAPTDVPTRLPTITPVSLDETDEANTTPSLEPTEETPTEEEATLVPAPVQSQGISDASLVGTIAYPVFNGSTYDIYFGQADGSGTSLFQGNASQPAFSPDGSRIAIHSWRLDARGLMTMDRSGGNAILVANFFEDQLPTWSADGSQILFLSRREGDRKSRIYRVGSFEERGAGVVLGEGEYPTIGLTNQLVFRGWGSTATGIRLSTATLENLQPVTDLDGDTAPALSPDGQKVVFMSSRTGNWEIFIANSDGSEVQQLTDNPAEDGLPTWSPDGQVIAFVSSRDGTWAMWATTPDGREVRQLFAMEGSPDGFVEADPNVSRGWLEERISWTP